MVAKRESSEEILVVSTSLRSERGLVATTEVGALIVLTIVFTTTGEWASKRKRRGILLVFCQINLVGA